MCSKPCNSVLIGTRTPCDSGARLLSIRFQRAVSDEAPAKSHHRNGAARARLQSHARTEHHRGPTASDGDENMSAPRTDGRSLSGPAVRGKPPERRVPAKLAKIPM